MIEDYFQSGSWQKELQALRVLVLNCDLQETFKWKAPCYTSGGRQRGYCLHFSTAKHSETRIARIERYADRILDGKGLNDCTCGLSKKMPQCDGSHKLR
jgi:uncharacterized protein YdeI (YjbR/CyaY-like superfamily)